MNFDFPNHGIWSFIGFGAFKSSDTIGVGYSKCFGMWDSTRPDSLLTVSEAADREFFVLSAPLGSFPAKVKVQTKQSWLIHLYEYVI